MEKFNSQICTSREQSERLLALGLKKETADFHWGLQPYYNDEGFDCGLEWSCNMGVFLQDDAHELFLDYIPAWSLHRLIELAMCNVEMNIFISRRCFWINRPHSPFSSDKRDGVYNGMIDYMRWLIEGGYLNKEYLNDENIH